MLFSEFGFRSDSETLASVQDFVDYAKQNNFDTKKQYLKSIEAAESVLEREPGLVDLPNKSAPTIVVPDLHARKDFLAQILATKYANASVLDRLTHNQINLVCLGDAMHSEVPTRWTAESAPFRLNEYLVEVSEQKTKNMIVEFKRILEREIPGVSYEQMSEQNIRTAFVNPEVEKRFRLLREAIEDDMLMQETAQSLGMMRMILDLKTLCPNSFYFVRGNHDDVNASLTKFNNESHRTALAISSKFGDNFLRRLADVQSDLPLVVKGNNFVASHAMPSRVLDREEIAGRSKAAIQALTATDNVSTYGRKIPEDYLVETMSNIGADNSSRWIIGHRRVLGPDGYREQYDGKLVQICDPIYKIIAIIPPDRPFIPKQHVKILS